MLKVVQLLIIAYIHFSWTLVDSSYIKFEVYVRLIDCHLMPFQQYKLCKVADQSFLKKGGTYTGKSYTGEGVFPTLCPHIKAWLSNKKGVPTPEHPLYFLEALCLTEVLLLNQLTYNKCLYLSLCCDTLYFNYKIIWGPRWPSVLSS